jgi:hypothetical protein
VIAFVPLRAFLDQATYHCHDSDAAKYNEGDYQS